MERRTGVGTPWNGISDFMYLRAPSARTGSPARSSSARRRRRRGELTRKFGKREGGGSGPPLPRRFTWPQLTVMLSLIFAKIPSLIPLTFMMSSIFW